MLIAPAAILVGFIILVWSADIFVAGAAAIARNMGMSPILIGLTIVSLGTSAPEVLVAISAAISGAGELAVGNAIGSNIANIGLVLGITVLIVPLSVQRDQLRGELPTLLVVTLGCGLLLLDRQLDWLDGLLMLTTLAFLLLMMIRLQTRLADADAEGAVEGSIVQPRIPGTIGEATLEALPQLPTRRAWLSFGSGLALLVGSSKLLVWGASQVALELGVSPLVIGLSVVAVGTSLPELATSLASALKGHAEIALGNVMGSNLFNLLGVMSLPGIFSTQMLEPMALSRDYASMTGLTLLLAALLYSGALRPTVAGHGHRLGRGTGVLFLLIYALYYYWLFHTAR